MRELSLHILDLVENSLEAGATRVTLTITEDHAENRIEITVEDDGRGMDAETVRRVTDPFFTTRTTRNVGLGVPLLKAAAERCQGELILQSQPGVGTRVEATFEWDHIDRAPLGDIKGTLLSILLFRSGADLCYRHRVDDALFRFDSTEIREQLGDVPLSHPAVREWLDRFLQENLQRLTSAHSAEQKECQDAETDIA